MTQQRVFHVISAGLLLAAGAIAVAQARATAPDPILSGPAPGPCADRVAAPDYVPGVDATGHPVVPAEGPDSNSGPGKGTVLLTVPTHHGGRVEVPVTPAELTPQPCKPQHR